MTFETLYTNLTTGKIKPIDAYNEMKKSDKVKRINYYKNLGNISNEPLKDTQLQELDFIVNICQILFNSAVDSPIDDITYDELQEILVNDGMPRLSGSIELNDNPKIAHKFTKLRGTLGKVYYLDPDEKRTNKSRKYLDEWIKATEALYERKTGIPIDLNKVKIMVQPKFDGVSTILEIDDKFTWITRGDTTNNLASDVSNILNGFNEQYKNYPKGTGKKFEMMCSEDNKEKINELYRHHPYHNSRQIVSAVVNSNDPDFKVDYLTPVPLRIYHDGDESEQIDPELIENFPTMICTFGDRDEIYAFAMENRYIEYQGMRFRTDGAVLTILDENIKRVLGRDNNINNFEVAYKFTEEFAYTKVKGVEFDTSDFGYICPVLVVNEVILKGNNVSHISLSTKERFDELSLSYGDEVKVLYDIIPYAVVDEKCKRVPNGRKIEFVTRCPACRSKLNLDAKQVQCTNMDCPSRFIGRILNYCQSLRIQNIGYSTLDMLYAAGLLDDGIISLYKLKKKTHQMMDLEGFGKVKSKKIVREIESKRKLRDADLFGSIGIEGLSIKTFESIFRVVKLSDFLNMIKMKNWDLMRASIIKVDKMGDIKTDKLIDYLKDSRQLSWLKRLLKEVSLTETYSNAKFIGRVVFTGCRPTDEMKSILAKHQYEATDGWSSSAKCLVVPSLDYESSKVAKARSLNIPIITINELENRLKSKGS